MSEERYRFLWTVIERHLPEDPEPPLPRYVPGRWDWLADVVFGGILLAFGLSFWVWLLVEVF